MGHALKRIIQINFPVRICDLADYDVLEAAIREFCPVGLMHFAASAHVHESTLNPGKYYRNNLVGLLNLIEAARRYGPVPLVFSSSCTVYENKRKSPISEASSLKPINPYGNTKAWRSVCLLISTPATKCPMSPCDILMQLALRLSIRPKFAASPILDGSRYTQNLERIFRQLWCEWCEKISP